MNMQIYDAAQIFRFLHVGIMRQPRKLQLRVKRHVGFYLFRAFAEYAHFFIHAVLLVFRQELRRFFLFLLLLLGKLRPDFVPIMLPFRLFAQREVAATVPPNTSSEFGARRSTKTKCDSGLCCTIERFAPELTLTSLNLE